VELEKSAQAAKKGLWKVPPPPSAIRNVLWASTDFPVAEMFAKWKGKPLKGNILSITV